MQEVRFLTTVGEDQVIRPPTGLLTPGSKVEVVVRPVVAKPSEPEADNPSMSDFDRMAATRAYLLRFAAEAEAIADPLPSDMAENHDHYAHGKPLEQATEEDPYASLREMLLGLAAEAERIAPPLPSDLAMNHDHYGHGRIRP